MTGLILENVTWITRHASPVRKFSQPRGAPMSLSVINEVSFTSGLFIVRPGCAYRIIPPGLSHRIARLSQPGSRVTILHSPP